MIQTAKIDEPLRAAVARGGVPGVVAMAATCDEVVYQDVRSTIVQDHTFEREVVRSARARVSDG